MKRFAGDVSFRLLLGPIGCVVKGFPRIICWKPIHWEDLGFGIRCRLEQFTSPYNGQKGKTVKKAFQEF